MGNGGSETQQRLGGKKKTPLQVQSLERLYSEDKHPNPKAMHGYAAPLGLTYSQVRKWFSDRRRKDRKVSYSKARKIQGGSHGLNRHLDANKGTAGSRQAHIQVLRSREYILTKVFRKDGPPLGTEFDPLPERAFDCAGIVRSLPASGDPKTVLRKRKNISKKSYGIGKGLMTAWRVTNPGKRSCPPTIDLADRLSVSDSLSKMAPPKRVPDPKHQSSYRKVKERQKHLKSKKKVLSSKRQITFRKCRLAMDELESPEQSNSSLALMDDEELELSELQMTSNHPRCSAHLTSNGTNGCPFCKDMLSRFPPDFVKMKHPFSAKPWVSSIDLGKKLFKVLRFLYTNAIKINICAFTIDELSMAFLEKDSLLLGKIHLALLKFFLSDVERETTSGFLARASQDCRFLGFIQSVQQNDFDVNFWVESLNPLTWTEILRQVLTAAGFGSEYSSRRGTLNKERNQMVQYGLRPHTLKGELFCLLSAQGSGGLKISELSRASQIVSLGFEVPDDELEHMIYCTFSSDITLFEKIAPSTFRLRIHSSLKKEEDGSVMGSDDSGCIDDEFLSPMSSCSSDEAERSAIVLFNQRSGQLNGGQKGKLKKRTPYTEIDESFSGEAWLLGLMEGEYSELTVEEKLDALVALVDLASSAFSLRVEDPAMSAAASVPVTCPGTGGKIKKSTYQHALARRTLGENFELTEAAENSKATNSGFAVDADANIHPLQSIHLGSDRRYNSYWLFLGPCHLRDPGHMRVYFESSEDGQWQVIDTKQVLSSLISSLDGRGTRESHLLASLQKIEVSLGQAMVEVIDVESKASEMGLSISPDSDIVSGSGSSPISDVDNTLVFGERLICNTTKDVSAIEERSRKDEEEKLRWEKLQAFDKWVCDSFYSNLVAVKKNKRSYFETLTRCGLCHDLYWRDEKHCRVCHLTFELDFGLEERYAIHVATCRKARECDTLPIHKVLPSQLQALKAAMHALEAAMPVEAMVDSWMKSSHKLWAKRLVRTSSLFEILQVIADFVAAIKVDWLCQIASDSSSTIPLDDVVVLFHTMPRTTSAVALWMLKLDSLIAQRMEFPCIEVEKNHA